MGMNYNKISHFHTIPQISETAPRCITICDGFNMKCVQQTGVGNDLSSAGSTALRGCGNFVGGYRWREQVTGV